MTDDKGYKDTKEFICTGCGKTIVLTKFASQKTCKCDECKANNVPINPDIVAQALQKNPPKQRKLVNAGGATKICQCINCGVDVEVSKFMSAQKVLCDACKGTSVSAEVPKMKIDRSKLSKVNIAPIEEYELNGGVIADRRLREVKCPKCGHEYMKPLSIIDWSQYGMLISYQCQECYLTMTLSEQTKYKMKTYSPGKRFDYTGQQIRDLGMSFRDQSRVFNALSAIVQWCDQHNINIDEIFNEYSADLPPYKWLNERPVSKGWQIPAEDKFIKPIDDAIKFLQSPMGATEDEFISLDKKQATEIIKALAEILKGDGTDVSNQ